MEDFFRVGEKNTKFLRAEALICNKILRGEQGTNYLSTKFFRGRPISYGGLQGPVVQRLISANPGLNLNLGFFFFCSKAFSWISFSILFRVSNHRIAGKKNKTEFAFLAFISEFKFCTNPGLS